MTVVRANPRLQPGGGAHIGHRRRAIHGAPEYVVKMTHVWESRSPRFRRYVAAKLVLSGGVALVSIVMWVAADLSGWWPSWGVVGFVGVAAQWQSARAHTSMTADCIVAFTGWRTIHVSRAEVLRLEPREFKNDVVVHRVEGKSLVLPCLDYHDGTEAQDICFGTFPTPRV